MNKFFRKLSIYFCFLVVLVGGFLLTSCCSPNPCKVDVKFVGADTRLGLENYSFYVDFNETAKIEFPVPKGYDSSKIISTINNKNIEYEVAYTKGQTVKSGYEYDVDKKVSITINFVRRSFELDIDLTAMQKLTFDITLNDEMNNFDALIIPQEKSTGYFTSLSSSDVLKTVQFVDGIASIEYGDYVVLMHNVNKDSKNYDTLYSQVNHFTSESNISSIGTINYSFYNKAKKGNTNYLYNNESNKTMYYLGEIKEDLNLYSQIPNYEKDKGFEIDRKANTFYLFTNMSCFNSDILTMTAYSSSEKTYNVADGSLDRIDGQTVEKVSNFDTYLGKYDLHKIYLGSNMSSDVLLGSEDKNLTNKDLYFVLESTLDLTKDINFYLLDDENQQSKNAYKLSVEKNKTEKGLYYIKLSSETLDKFSQIRDMVYYGSVRSYKTGLAILYPEIDYNFFHDTKESDYLRIYKNIIITNNNSSIDTSGLQVNLYLKDDSGNNYGFVDNHSWPNTSLKRDCVYFKTSDLFVVGESKKTFKNNVYIEIKGNDYENFKSVKIKSVSLKNKDMSLTKYPIEVSDPKIFNGITDYKVGGFYYDELGEYTLTISITLCDPVTDYITLDFSHLQLPNNYSQGLYITANDNFEDISGFMLVNGGNKDTFNSLKFGKSGDLYYFSNCNLDIEVRLDPDDPTTVISSSQYFKDIKGEKIKININGEPYNILVIKQDIIYELISSKMYVVNKS